MSKRREYRLYGKRQSGGKKIVYVGLFILVFFLAHLVLSSFLLSSYVVGSVSMSPTLRNSERIFTTPLAYGPPVPFSQRKIRPITTPNRGSLVVVQPPYFRTTAIRRVLAPFVSFFTANRIRFESSPDFPYERAALIRRVVGLPGDTIRIDGFAAYIRIEGDDEFVEEHKLANRDYAVSAEPLPEGWGDFLPASGTTAEITLKPGEYYLLSDNRSMTNDSRYWGPLELSSFTGKVLFRYWPFDKIGVP